ncbi:dienelactone hydrolase family protein [Kitasatospora sp. NBC_00315]|uniref:dienelactone hydrolase family protein n=1 Tax=Kitasatospora sp. NBC_00315 TaxID=2975963 RepID=UPI003249083C
MADHTISGQWVPLGGPDGPEAYVAGPEGRESAGAVIVGGEMFGVNAHLRDVCHRLAAAGYTAIAPDFYWRSTRRAGLGYGDEVRPEAFGLMQGLRREEVLADLAAARAYGSDAAPDGGTALLGFSLGGHIAVLGASELRFDLVVSYYGGWLLDGGLPLADPVPPVANSERIAANTGFLLAFFGADDFVMSLDEWHRIGTRLRGAGVACDLVTYEGVGHGFFNDERPATYEEKTAHDAWGRTLDALALHVGRGRPDGARG